VIAITRSKLYSETDSHIGVLTEWLFALFLFAGYYKADPRLSFIQTYIDITLLFFLLSVSAFLYRGFKYSFAINIPRDFTKIMILFILFAFCLLIGLFYTKSLSYGFEKALRFVFLTGWAFFGIAYIIHDFSSLTRFFWAIVAISTFMAVDGLLKYQGVGQMRFLTAFGSNYIALARAGGIGMLTAVLLLLPLERRPFLRLNLLVSVTLLLFATLMAGSRGPVLALVFSILIFFALSIRGFPVIKIDRFTLRLNIILLLITIMLASVGQKLFTTLLYRSEILVTEVGASAAERLYLYQAAIDLWKESPILGIGTGQFGLAVTGQDVRLYPHNIILEIGVENGLLGGLVLLALIIASLRIGFSQLKSTKRLEFIVARYLLVISFFALFNAMVSGDINDNRILFALLGLIGIIKRFRYDRTIKGHSLTKI